MNLDRAKCWAPLTAALTAALLAACGGSGPEPAAPPSSRAAKTKPLPALEPSKIVFAMGGIENDFRKCFFRNPRDRGTLHVRWQADTEGVVEDAEIVHSTLTTEAVKQCLLGRVGDLRFGRLAQKSQGEWVFVFRLATPPKAKTTVEPKPKQGKLRKQQEESEQEEEEGISVQAGSPGWLEPGRIADIVEAGLGLYARCYRSGLNRQEHLSGHVRFQLVIGTEGRVERIEDQGSDLPDLFAVDCVAEGFYALVFPKPERGPVHVNYRMRLN